MIINRHTFRILYIYVVVILLIIILSYCSCTTTLNNDQSTYVKLSDDNIYKNENPMNSTSELANGEIKVFEKNGLFAEVTKVASSGIMKGHDDAFNLRETMVYTLYPGAQIKVIDTDTVDTESNWSVGFIYSERVDITNDITLLEYTSDMCGILHLESSTYVLIFLMYKE